MSRFIRLTNLIINTHNITTIKNSHSKYIISLKQYNIEGSTVFGCGGINTIDEKITICEKKDESDYVKIKHWIDTLDSKGWLYEGNGNSVLECNEYCRKVTFMHSKPEE